MARQELNLRFRMNGRVAEVNAYDTVGVEDAFTILAKAALHRVITREDWLEPTSRDVKDWIIKTNLTI